MSTKVEKPPKQPPKTLSLKRSFGKLPRLSKEMIYDSVRNQPIPQMPLALAPAAHGASVANGAIPVDNDKPASPTWRNYFPFSRRGSKADHGPGSLLAMDSPLPLAALGTQPPKAGSLSAGTSKTLKERARSYADLASLSLFDDTPRAIPGDESKRSGNLLEALSLPFRKHATKGSHRARSKSDATIATDDSLPETPLQTLQFLDRHESSPILNIRAHTGGFDHYVQRSSPLDLESHYVDVARTHGNVEGSPEAKKNRCLPPLSESMISLRTVESEFDGPNYFIPCMGLSFPLPPSCTEEDVTALFRLGIDVEDAQGRPIFALPRISPASMPQPLQDPQAYARMRAITYSPSIKGPNNKGANHF